LRLVPARAIPIGIPTASVRSERFVPLGSVGGIGPRLRPAERRLGHCPVGRQSGSVDADLIVVVEQSLTPDLVEDAGLLPLLKAAVGRGSNGRSQ
jgi:hypothetical protein